MKKNVELRQEERINKKTGKSIKVLIVEMPSGVTFQVSYSFYNYKLAYRIQKELEELK